MRYAIAVLLLLTVALSSFGNDTLTLQEELAEIFQELRTALNEVQQGLVEVQQGQNEQQQAWTMLSRHLIDLNSSFLDYQVVTDSRLTAAESELQSQQTQTMIASGAAVVSTLMTILVTIWSLTR